jgi:hypothetical protein
MNVQPYFPEPVTVPGNAANASYGKRLRFIRRVVAGHFATVLLVAAMVVWGPTDADARSATILIFFCLLGLTVTRRLAPHTRIDLAASVLLIFPLLAALGVVIREGIDYGLPLWSLGIAATTSLAYTMLCGRDFSFMGLYVLAGGVCTILIAILAIFERVSATVAAAGCTMALGGLFYFVYDLAALLTRRRLGEEAAAVADLYRDVLNFTTYSFRVIAHWRKFRI